MPNILIVEDDPGNRLFVEKVLSQNNHDCTAAACGRDALTALTHSAPDLVVLDIKLPDMGGTDIALFIRNSPAPLATAPILAITAYAMRDNLDRFRQDGIDDCLIKPFSGDELLAAVDRLLQR